MGGVWECVGVGGVVVQEEAVLRRRGLDVVMCIVYVLWGCNPSPPGGSWSVGMIAAAVLTAAARALLLHSPLPFPAPHKEGSDEQEASAAHARDDAHEGRRAGRTTLHLLRHGPTAHRRAGCRSNG